jgi:hypothetical protein
VGSSIWVRRLPGRWLLPITDEKPACQDRAREFEVATVRVKDWYSSRMDTVKAGLQYLGAALVGLIIAFLATGLISYAMFPPDGPIGEGLVMMLIYLLSCCICVPGYVALMAMHRRGSRETRGLIASEVILRASVIVGACLFCFVTVELPTMMVTKWLACSVGVFACAWALGPTFREQSRG